jgi:hypothetical protein
MSIDHTVWDPPLVRQSFDEVPAWAIWTFAIFKRTGALHTVTDGAASDDPIWTP